MVTPTKPPAPTKNPLDGNARDAGTASNGLITAELPNDEVSELKAQLIADLKKLLHEIKAPSHSASHRTHGLNEAVNSMGPAITDNFRHEPSQRFDRNPDSQMDKIVGFLQKWLDKLEGRDRGHEGREHGQERHNDHQQHRDTHRGPAKHEMTYREAINNLQTITADGHVNGPEEIAKLQKSAEKIKSYLEARIQNEGAGQLSENQQKILGLAQKLTSQGTNVEEYKGIVDEIVKADKGITAKGAEKNADGKAATLDQTAGKTEPEPMSKLIKEKGKLDALGKYNDTLGDLVEKKLITEADREELFNRATKMPAADVGKMDKATQDLVKAHEENRKLDDQRHKGDQVGLNDLKNADNNRLRDTLIAKDQNPDGLTKAATAIKAGTAGVQAEITGEATKANEALKAAEAKGIATGTAAGIKSATPDAEGRQKIANEVVAGVRNEALNAYKKELEITGITGDEATKKIAAKTVELNNPGLSQEELEGKKTAQLGRNDKLNQFKSELSSYAHMLEENKVIPGGRADDFVKSFMAQTGHKIENLDAAITGVKAKHEAVNGEFKEIAAAKATSQHERELAQKSAADFMPAKVGKQHMDAATAADSLASEKIKLALKGAVSFDVAGVKIEMGPGLDQNRIQGPASGGAGQQIAQGQGAKGHG